MTIITVLSKLLLSLLEVIGTRDQSLLGILWVAKDPRLLQVDNEDCLHYEYTGWSDSLLTYAVEPLLSSHTGEWHFLAA